MGDPNADKLDLVGEILDNMAAGTGSPFDSRDQGAAVSKQTKHDKKALKGKSNLNGKPAKKSKSITAVQEGSKTRSDKPNNGNNTSANAVGFTMLRKQVHGISDADMSDADLEAVERPPNWFSDFKNDYKNQMHTFSTFCANVNKELKVMKDMKDHFYDESDSTDWQCDQADFRDYDNFEDCNVFGEPVGYEPDSDMDRPSTSRAGVLTLEDGEILESSEKKARHDINNDFMDTFMMEISRETSAGPAVGQKLAKIIDSISRFGIAENKRTQLLDLSKRPENCPLLSVAKMNTELWDFVRSETRARDAKMQKVSQTLIAGLLPVVEMVHTMMISVSKGTNLPSRTTMIQQLTNAISLLLDSKHDLDMRRRELLRPELQSDYRTLCNPKNAVTEYLFGDDLSKNIKDISDMNRVTARVHFRGAGSFRGRGRGTGFRGRRGRFLGRPYPRRGADYRSYRGNANRGKTPQK